MRGFVSLESGRERCARGPRRPDRRGLVLAALWAFSSAACEDAVEVSPGSGDLGGDVDLSPEEATFAQVQAIFTRSCALDGCHHRPDPTAEMSLEEGLAYDNIVNVGTVSYCGADGIRVVPGDPDASCMWQLLSQDIMPLVGGPLPDEDKETIRAWIAAGALPD